MKKKLEAELISIAHRVLKLKGKEDVILLHQEAQKLYEKLSVLRFYEENFNALKEEITIEALESKLENPATPAVATPPVAITLKEETAVLPETTAIPAEETQKDTTPETVATEEITQTESTPAVVETIVASIAEESDTKDTTATETEDTVEVITPAFTPSFEFTPEEDIKEEKEVNESSVSGSKQISLEDFLDASYKEPEFVKINDVPQELEVATNAVFEKVSEPEVIPVVAAPASILDQRGISLNDTILKGINIGLNDRIAFVKHLFGGSNEDFNRVISQLNTLHTFNEAKEFVEDLVKPDYNQWKGKEDYAERFMEIVEKKFN